MALTKIQLERVTAKITDAKTNFIEAHKAAAGLVERPAVDEYTDKQKLAMIVDGQAKLKRSDYDPYGYVTGAFSYPDMPGQAAQRAARDAFDKAVKAIEAEADAIAERLLDQVIFDGDGMAAINRIDDAFKV